MREFLDAIAHAFERIGVHPMLGAFLAGAIIAFVFARRKSSSSDPVLIEPPTPVLHRSRPLELQSESSTSHSMQTAPPLPAQGTVTFKGRTYDLPVSVVASVRAGNKIAAIKELRSATGMDLASAKQVVDRIAALPAR